VAVAVGANGSVTVECVSMQLGTVMVTQTVGMSLMRPTASAA